MKNITITIDEETEKAILAIKEKTMGNTSSIIRSAIKLKLNEGSSNQAGISFVPIATKKGVVNLPRDVYDKIVSMKNEDREAAEILAFQVLGVQPHEYPPVGANNWGNIILNFFK